MAGAFTCFSIRTIEGRLHIVQVAAAVIALPFILSLSSHVFWWMAFVFREPREDMGHGWIVPLFSLGLVWQRRRELAASVGTPSWRGVACVVLGLILFWIGERGDSTDGNDTRHVARHRQRD